MKRVLIVDDDRAMCEWLEADLGAHGFEVLTRSSAPQAMAALATSDVDAVLTDLKMPGTSGLAARILGVDRKTLHRRLDRWSAAEAAKTGS